MPWTLHISHTFENLAFSWSWKACIVTVVNTKAVFFFIFISRRNVKERNTHTPSRKFCRIQPIRWWLQNSWSVSNFVCHMHQMFSQLSVGVTAEAETTCHMKDQHMPFLKSCVWALTVYIHLLTNFTKNSGRWTNAEVQVFLYPPAAGVVVVVGWLMSLTNSYWWCKCNQENRGAYRAKFSSRGLPWYLVLIPSS